MDTNMDVDDKELSIQEREEQLRKKIYEFEQSRYNFFQRDIFREYRETIKRLSEDNQLLREERNYLLIQLKTLQNLYDETLSQLH